MGQGLQRTDKKHCNVWFDCVSSVGLPRWRGPLLTAEARADE